MPTTTHQSVSAIEVLQTIQGFLKTVDRIEIELDDMRISDSILSHLIDCSVYFEQGYVDQLEELRKSAGACIAQACQLEHIPGLRHWTDNHPDSLETNYHKFQQQYAEFLNGICQAAGELEAEAGEELTEQDLAALYHLTGPLASPLMLAKSYLTASMSPSPSN